MSNNVHDFESYITERTKNFTGREWVFQEIDKWLADPDASRFFVITGEPGIGKSSIAAKLTKIRNINASHFCIARKLETISPYNFVSSLSIQLCKIDGFAQHILKTNDIIINSHQKIRKNYGKAIGVHIENLMVKTSSPTVAYDNTVIKPLNSLYRSGFKQLIVILVDALDEGIQYPGDENIIDLIANSTGLPHQIRFILTTRPEIMVTRHLEPIKTLLFLDKKREENFHDIEKYIFNHIESSKELKSRIENQNIRSEYVKRLINASDGNFLYLSWLLPEFISGKRTFDMLSSLPEGLDEIYLEFFRTRMVGKDISGKWRDIYRPVFRILTAAFEPLSIDQLIQFTGISKQSIDDCLTDIQQYLDPVQFEKEKYVLYHQSVGEFLHSKEKSKEFAYDPAESHRQIADYCRRFWKNNDLHDQYALRYYLRHLWEFKSYSDMVNICENGYLDVKIERLVSPEILEEDYHLLFNACRKSSNLIEFLKWGLHRAKISDQVSAVRDVEKLTELIGMISQRGRNDWWKRGVGLCILIPSVFDKIKTLLGLCKGLKVGSGEAPKIVLEQINILLQEVPPGHKKDGLLEDYVYELCRWGTDYLSKAYDAAFQLDSEWTRAWALGIVAKNYARLCNNTELTLKIFQQIFKEISRIKDIWSRFKLLAILAQGCIKLGYIKDAKTLLSYTANIKELTIVYNSSFSEVLIPIAEAFIQIGDIEKAKDLFVHMSTAAQNKEEEFRTEALVTVAKGYGQVEMFNEGGQLLEHALKFTMHIKEKLDYYLSIIKIGRAFVRMGMKNRGEEILYQIAERTKHIENIKDRAWILFNVILSYDSLKENEKVLCGLEKVSFLAEQIQDIYDQLKLLVNVALGYFKINNYEKASNLLKTVRDLVHEVEYSEYRAEIYVEIAKGYIQFNDIENALQTLEQSIGNFNTVRSEINQAKRIVEIAQSYINLLLIDKAKELLKQSLDIAFQISKYMGSRIEILILVANEYVRIGYLKETEVILDQILDIIASNFSDKGRIWKLVPVAELYIKMQQIEKALDILEQALELTLPIQDENDRYICLRDIINLYSLIHPVQTTEKKLHQILKAANSFHDQSYIIKIYRIAAKSYINERKTEDAMEILTQALDIAIQIESRMFQTKSLEKLAEDFAQIGDNKQAEKGLTRIFQEGEIMKAKPRSVADCVTGYQVSVAVARSYVRMGNIQKGEEIIQSILGIAIALSNAQDNSIFISIHANDWAEMLISIAQEYIQLNNDKQAELALNVANNFVQKIKSESWITPPERDRYELFILVAEGYSQIRQMEKAVMVMELAMDILNQKEEFSTRSRALSIFVKGYANIMKIEEAFNLLGYISEDRYFLDACKYIFKKIETVTEHFLNIQLGAYYLLRRFYFIKMY